MWKSKTAEEDAWREEDSGGIEELNEISPRIPGWMKRNIYIYIVYTCRRSLYSSSSNFSFPPFPFFLPFLLPLSIKKSPRRGAPFGKKGIVGRSAPSKLHIARKLPSILRPHGIKRVFSLGDERRIEDISILFFYDPLVELYNSNCAKRLLWRNWYPYQSCSRCGTTTKTDSFLRRDDHDSRNTGAKSFVSL